MAKTINNGKGIFIIYLAGSILTLKGQVGAIAATIAERSFAPSAFSLIDEDNIALDIVKQEGTVIDAVLIQESMRLHIPQYGRIVVIGI